MTRKLTKADRYIIERIAYLRQYLNIIEETTQVRGASYAAHEGSIPITILKEAAKIWTALSRAGAE